MKDVTLRRFAGINNVLDPMQIANVPSREAPQVELTEALNVDLDEAGRLLRRSGRTRHIEGACHSLWGNGGWGVFIRDGVMYRLDADYSTHALAGGLSDAPMSYVAVGERVYHANGRQSAVIDQGRVRSWGMAAADCSVSATTGALEAGLYQAALTYLREDGQESGAGPAHRLDLGPGSGIEFHWAVPADLGITGVALYVSAANGETLFQADVRNVEDASATYAGGARALPLETAWLDKPPAGQQLAYCRGRIYIAVDDVLYATAPLGYEYVDLRDYRAIDGSRITLLAGLDGGLVVGTARGVYFLAGATLADQTLTLKFDAPAVAGSLALADGAQVTGRRELDGVPVALFATEEGLCLALPDGTMNNLTRERFVMPAVTRGAAVFDPRASRYLLSLST